MQAAYSASGSAAATLALHHDPADLTLFGSPFCPFTQRVWIALEVKEISYQFWDALTRPAQSPPIPVTCSSNFPEASIPSELVSLNPDKILPCIKHGNWATWESHVVLEYLEDLSMGHTLLPLGDPRLRAHCRLWVDHINRKVLPAFYTMLIAPSGDAEIQNTLVRMLQSSIESLVNASHATGPFFLGKIIGFVDVAFAPWIIRLSRVLSQLRQWPSPETGSRWESWVQAVESDERVQRTISETGSYERLYMGLDSFYRENDAETTAKDFVCYPPEAGYAKRLVRQEGFGVGGDILGKMVDL